MKKTLLFFALLFTTAFGYTAQAAESRTVACTAGNLATMAASYLTTVTNLTVTGTIDARDFKTMRDAMPLLEVIDLSGSTVSAYTGKEGTIGAPSTDYPANGIPTYAFYYPSANLGKTSLTTFIYPVSVTTIGNNAFTNCISLNGSLTIPALVTTIGDYAFSCCSGFTGSLTIPSSVTTIGSNAFAYCRGFKGSIIIPSSITTIGDAFWGCSGLFEVNEANPNYSSLDGVLYNKNKTTLIQCLISKTGTLTIPTSVTTIGNWAFWGCSGLTGSLTIPSSVTTIGDWAFIDCSGLTGSLTIPSSVTTIGNWAFLGCSGLTGMLTIPSSVTTIRDFTFDSCSGFTGSLTIPSSITTIGDFAFWGCSGLTSIYSYATTPIDISASQDVFTGVNKTTCILHVPFGSKVLYSKANQWKDFTNIVEDIPNSLNEVSSNSISIYPNPAISTITVSELSSVVSDKAITLSITDVSGNSVLTKSIEPTLNSATIDVSSLSNGAYVMVIQSSNGKVVKRFLKR